MKERPKQKQKVEFEDDTFDNKSALEYSEKRQDEIEETFLEMQETEEQLSFCQDVIEEIKNLTEYHVLPIAEHITPDHLEAFLEKVKNQ
jgi:hypothetical protein